QPGVGGPRPSFVNGEALLMFKDGVTPEQKADFYEEYGVEVVKDGRSYTLVRFPVEKDAAQETREMIARMKEDERIKVAEANGLMYPARQGGLSPMGPMGPGMLL
ncbi:MAG: hypothetical protein AB1758_28195, partial [Candidatus Eremiobacterota bacterium]